MQVSTILFDDFETLDVFGPVEVFGRLADHFNPEFYSLSGGLVTSRHNVKVDTKPVSDLLSAALKLKYILFIPGGQGVRKLVNDPEYIEMLRQLATSAEYVFTVCTGSTLFAKTGLLDGKSATSNKRAMEWTKSVNPKVEWVDKARWIRADNIYTSAGISAGIDMALGFVSDLLGYDIAKQQSNEIEYSWHEDSLWDPFSALYVTKPE
mmetsp:Transcript_147/g.130  ORF Transcript_147/g.130 Transcript_147/m.130 type:complete len:208 (+) Transcript_147:148-771(+)|eukprot:CAMPEP_0184018978 /NCGR_PEP_ID=MMETSP0954-20121128/8480_1 /TAXON_ID=627963 /ORGANISM="Aplanochytrium sp, Strain PBS07" /LENGTH=207 /DNA_ID=CAMNT_0026300561 /DNA_START=50 /DNA_END=673 /DNA_ORIENTATION=+